MPDYVPWVLFAWAAIAVVLAASYDGKVQGVDWLVVIFWPLVVPVAGDLATRLVDAAWEHIRKGA